MKRNLKVLIFISALLSLSGCSDAEKANFSRIGEEQLIKCYSGGKLVFEDISTGITAENQNGIYYKSKKDNKFTQVYMDCIIKDIN